MKIEREMLQENLRIVSEEIDPVCIILQKDIKEALLRKTESDQRAFLMSGSRHRLPVGPRLSGSVKANLVSAGLVSRRGGEWGDLGAA